MVISSEEPTAAPDQEAVTPVPVGGRFLPDVPPLAPDAVLLHIGVHKTGTTAIQAALTDARPELRQHGVYYPGKRPAQHRSALAILQRPWGWVDRGAETYDRSVFDWLARRTNEHEGRTVISSEFFCEANEDSAAEIAQALGGDKVHVVVGLRNLGSLLPSSWQQYLKYGMATGYIKWLRNVFEEPGGSSMTPTFWMRMDHEAVVRRWAKAVGPENMTVLVLEDVDRRAMFRTFEQLLDIPVGTLESRMDLTSNRSLTAMESQLLLDLNRQVARDLEWLDYQRYVRRGLALRLVEDRQPPPDEPRLYTPPWALEAAAEMGGRAAEWIGSSGVRVLGDLETLRKIPPTGTPTDLDERRTIPSEVAVAAVKAIIDTALQPVNEEVVSTRALADELWERIKTEGRSRWIHRSFRAR
jgi:hypothetical protein